MPRRAAAQGSGRRIGIRDIAARCAVSTCTVSKILNGKDGGIYPADTVQRVRCVASELGYRADLVARALVAGRTGVVGLCVGDISLPFFGEFAARFERGMDGRGGSTLICDSREDPAIEARYVATLLARRVDALVIAPVDGGSGTALAAAAAAGCRVVLFDRDLPGDGFARVVLDNRGAMASLAARCLALGHRRIGVLRGRQADSSLAERLHGVRDACAAAGLGVDALACAGDASTAAAGDAGLAALMAAPRPPTLVLSLCGALTIGALAACQRLGLAPGREISLAGFDDFPAAALIPPGITVITNPVDELAERCVRLAAGEEPAGPPPVPAIIWRGSVRVPAEG